MSFSSRASGGKVRGSGVRRSPETTGHISRLSRNEQPKFSEGGSEWQAAIPVPFSNQKHHFPNMPFHNDFNNFPPFFYFHTAPGLSLYHSSANPFHAQ